MGRVIVVLLFAVLVVPALLLWRIWRQAGQRRLVNEATLGFLTPTVQAERTLRRWPVRARAVRAAGLVAGLGLVVVLALRVGTLSVFAWPLAICLGYLLGVLVGELTRPRPLWSSSGSAVGRLSDYISPSLVWALRASALLTIGVATTATVLSEPTGDGSSGLSVSCARGGSEMIGSGQITTYAVLVLALAAGGWLVSEVSVLRLLRRPGATEPEDVPVDEALRSASAHASVAAASVLTLLPLGGFALVTGLAIVGSCAASDLVGVTLIAGGFAALLAGLLVAAFLPSWLRPVQRQVDVKS